MPVKIWEVDETGQLYSRIVTGWDTLWTGEEHRQGAEELDRVLDLVLDDALSKANQSTARQVPKQFMRAWAVGQALLQSGVFESAALKNERRELLWRALARKCRTGARSTSEIDGRWQALRPASAAEPRREGGRLDYFEMCRWLAEQDLGDALAAFGGHVRNVWQMLERPTLRAPALRKAFVAWLRSLPEKLRDHLLEPKTFPEMMKALRQRWPDRGPGSAKRPIHYSEEHLVAEIRQLLDLLAEAVGHQTEHERLEGTHR